jgi:poly-gamma-glutamate synthesis protein (capsule biosynthesis protein)
MTMRGSAGTKGVRGDLGLTYFVSMDLLTGNLVGLQMNPTQIRNFKVNLASRADALWLRDTLNREGVAFGTPVDLDHDNTLTLHWD